MHSLGKWLLVAGGVLGVRGIVLPAPAPAPAITTAPQPVEDVFRLLEHRQEPDLLTLAQVLLTALPLSLRLIAATNIPAVSSILWEDFLDDKKPEWFLDLPQDIQSYLIVEFGPETAWPTAAPTTEDSASQATATATDSPSNSDLSTPTPSGSASISTLPSSTGSASSTLSRVTSDSSSRNSLASSTASSATRSSSSPSSSSSADPLAPLSSNAGLSREQKIGLGVGIPLALLALAAILFACCLCLRRRKKRHNDGTEPPASPGFIPRFSFQDNRPLAAAGYADHRTPLNPTYNHNHPSRFVEDTQSWDDDDGYEPAAIAASHRRDTFPPSASTAGPTQPMAMHDPQPIIAPLLHTHSSRKARGKRTSYTSLHSVAEVTEPDDNSLIAESPILGRKQSPPKTGPRRPSMPSVVETPATPLIAGASIKRKPLPSSPISSPAANAASASLLRPTLLASTAAQHSGSSSSGLALSSASASSSTSALRHTTDSPVSPITQHTPPASNPFSNDYAYLEDYGPEYSYDGYDGGYEKHDDSGLYGGNRSLDRYPEYGVQQQRGWGGMGMGGGGMSGGGGGGPKTEWPLRNVLGSIKRNKSPMWDRVYESP